MSRGYGGRDWFLVDVAYKLLVARNVGNCPANVAVELQLFVVCAVGGQEIFYEEREHHQSIYSSARENSQ